MTETNQPTERLVFGVLLAAGLSQRFAPHSKLTAEFEGTSLLRLACNALAGSCIDSSTVVLGKNAAQLHHHCDAAGLPWTVNARAKEGQSTSLVCGLEQVPTTYDGCLFMVADQPLLEARHVDAIVRAGRVNDHVAQATAQQKAGHLPNSFPLAPEFIASNPADVQPNQGPRRGTPVYFPRRYFHQLRQSTGDEGARQVLRHLPTEQVIDVELPSEALFDVDRPSDLKILQTRNFDP